LVGVISTETFRQFHTPVGRRQTPLPIDASFISNPRELRKHVLSLTFPKTYAFKAAGLIFQHLKIGQDRR
jgi:hypothetical protein